MESCSGKPGCIFQVHCTVGTTWSSYTNLHLIALPVPGGRGKSGGKRGSNQSTAMLCGYGGAQSVRSCPLLAHSSRYYWLLPSRSKHLAALTNALTVD